MALCERPLTLFIRALSIKIASIVAEMIAARNAKKIFLVRNKTVQPKKTPIIPEFPCAKFMTPTVLNIKDKPNPIIPYKHP
jgi:hypothetical protein